MAERVEAKDNVGCLEFGLLFQSFHVLKHVGKTLLDDGTYLFGARGLFDYLRKIDQEPGKRGKRSGVVRGCHDALGSFRNLQLPLALNMRKDPGEGVGQRLSVWLFRTHWR